MFLPQAANQLFSIIQNLDQLTTLQAKTIQACTLDDHILWVAYSQSGTLFIQNFDIHSLQFKNKRTLTPDPELPQQIIKFKIVNDSFFFISEKPFSLFMSFKDTGKVTKVKLMQENLPEEDFVCEICFPNIYVFGGIRKNGSLLESLLEINMYTFQIISHNLKYCPEPRIKSCCHLSDNRLYIFGGDNKNNQPIKDNLLWTFDIDKRCWFGLQFMGPPVSFSSKDYRTIELKDGKLVIICLQDSRIYSVSLSQSCYQQQKSKQKHLGEIITPQKFWEQSSVYQCPIFGSSINWLLIFDKYQTMIEHQMKKQFMC